MRPIRTVVLSAGLVFVGGAATCVVIDYSPSVTVSGDVRTGTGDAVPHSIVRVLSSVRSYGGDSAVVGPTGAYTIEVRQGMGPKVMDAGSALVICDPPSGTTLRPDTVLLDRFILRADRDVTRRADCVLSP